MSDYSAVMLRRALCALIAGAFSAVIPAAFAAGWEPSKPVEFVVPAGTGVVSVPITRIDDPTVIVYRIRDRRRDAAARKRRATHGHRRTRWQFFGSAERCCPDAG